MPLTEATSDAVPEFEAGNLALDLLNTGATVGGGTDVLASPASLLEWLARCGLGNAAGMAARLGAPPVVRTLLREARHLRHDVGVLVAAHRRGVAVPDHVVYALNRVLATSRTTRGLTIGLDGASLVEQETSLEPLAVLEPVARAAVLLLRDAEPRRVRGCAAPDCGRWFLDTSKAGRRKWCSMSTCGNRAKAARHRKRTASA